MGLDLAGQPVQLHMPAQRGNALGQRLQHVQPHGCIVLGVQRKADAANAAVMQRLQLCVGDLGVHYGNAARACSAQRLDGVQRGPVVRAMRTRLDDDGALQPHGAAQLRIVGSRGMGAHGLLCLGPKTCIKARIEHVQMGVAGASGQCVHQRLSCAAAFSASVCWPSVGAAKAGGPGVRSNSTAPAKPR